MNLFKKFKFPRKILFLFFLFPAFVFAEFNVENWLFYKEITLPQNLPEKAPVAIQLDNEVLSGGKFDLSDLRVIKDGKEEIPFQIITKGGEEISSKVEVILVSSLRTPTEVMNFDPQRMIDKNQATFYENDPTKDQTKTYFIVDLKRTTLTKKVAILSTEPLFTFTSVQIEGSNDLKNWEIIKPKIFLPYAPRREIAYPESFFRYLKFEFEHTGSLRIHEIEIYSAPEVFLVFLAEKNKNYQLYYGNDLAELPSYKVRFSLENAFWGFLGSQKSNPLGLADYDKDGILNQFDNCPFVFNPNQEDTDEDKIGDLCDNCPSLKNQSQLDRNKNGQGDICEDDDKDGILNLIDNCPLYSNPDQKDENKNGIGDACEDFDNDGIINDRDNCPHHFNPRQEDQDRDRIGDLCDPQDDRWTERYPELLWIMIGIVVIVIGFFTYRLFRQLK